MIRDIPTPRGWIFRGVEERRCAVGKGPGHGEAGLATLTVSRPAWCMAWERAEQMAEQFWGENQQGLIIHGCGKQVRGTGLRRCQGFLVQPPGQGSWCSYEQKQEINLLIWQPLLATHPQPFTTPFSLVCTFSWHFEIEKARYSLFPNFPCS